jgi:DNA-binding IscR family transcriptional regulator
MFTNKLIVAVAVLREIDRRSGPQVKVPVGTTVSYLGKKLGFSTSYMEQLLQPLREAGYVRGIKGTGGGYYITLQTPYFELIDLKDLAATLGLKQVNVGVEFTHDFSELQLRDVFKLVQRGH